MLAPLLLGTLIGCGGSDKALTELSGAWEGAATVQAQPYTIFAQFDFVDESYLTGTVLVQDPRGDRTYAVRRAEVFGSVISVDLQDDATVEFLDLDGELEGGAFTGTATLTLDCGAGQPCGWQGPFSLSERATGPTPGTQPEVVNGTNTGDTGL